MLKLGEARTACDEYQGLLERYGNMMAEELYTHVKAKLEQAKLILLQDLPPSPSLAVAMRLSGIDWPVGRVSVTLRRGPNGGLGLGLSPENRVSTLHPNLPADSCGMIRLNDLLVAVDGAPVSDGQSIAPLLPTDHDTPIEFTFVRETPPPSEDNEGPAHPEALYRVMLQQVHNLP